MARATNRRVPLAMGGLVIGLVLTACGSGSSSPTTSAASSPTTRRPLPPRHREAPRRRPMRPRPPPPVRRWPRLRRRSVAPHRGPIQTPTPGGGVVCEYTGARGNAGVTIFAHQSATVFAGQVSHAPGNPAMPAISGVGDGAYGMTSVGDRSIVNAYSNGSRTVVAAQANGSLASVEALARAALAAN